MQYMKCHKTKLIRLTKITSTGVNITSLCLHEHRLSLGKTYPGGGGGCGRGTIASWGYLSSRKIQLRTLVVT